MRDRPTDQHTHVIDAPPGSVRHHQNEDKADNAETNLTPMTRSAHTTMHNRTRGLSRLRAALRMVKEGRKLY